VQRIFFSVWTRCGKATGGSGPRTVAHEAPRRQPSTNDNEGRALAAELFDTWYRD
jgi:hypothetical protein